MFAQLATWDFFHHESWRT